MNLPRTAVALALAATLAHPTSRPASAHSTLAWQERCPDSEFTCIRLQVPLDHFGASPHAAERIEVVFGVLPARDRSKRKGLFVTAVGGPGASGLQAADAYAATFDEAIRDAFDVVFFDQRGIGLSGHLDCAEAAATYYQSDGRSRTSQQERALINAARRFVENCLKSLPSPEALQFYNTRQAVEDLEAFRRLVGEERIWLYGESYGTQFAQWYAAAHPGRVAGLILDGAVDLTLDGIRFAFDTTRAFNDALVTTLAACDAVPACRRDVGGDAVRAYDRLAGQLDRAPVTFQFPLPGGASVGRALGPSELETAAAGFLYTEGERMLLQRAIASATAGDFVPLARLFYAALGIDPATLSPLPSSSDYSDAAYYVFTCNDYRYFDGAADARARAYLQAGDRMERQVPRMQSVFYGDLPCAFWPQQAAPAVYDPRPARQIPTLILGATADPATPVQQGRAIARRLDNARLIITQGGAHVTFNRGNACPDHLVTQFLVAGELPHKAETRCDGAIADDYAPIAPADAQRFADVLEALRSFEVELRHLPEYYYWDGADEQATGCTRGGDARFMPAEAPERATQFTWSACAFSEGFVVSGAGLHDPERDRFTMDVRVSGYRAGALSYVRQGESIRVTGLLDNQALDLQRG